MAKGENIFKRKDGRWEARYIKGYELSGKIQYGFCYGKTYKEAKEKVTAYKAALLNGDVLPNKGKRNRFSFFCDEWFRGLSCTCKESTLVKYGYILDKHIKPKLGGAYPAGISTGLVDSFRDELINKDGLSPKSVKDILMVLRSILKYTSKQYPGVFQPIEITYPREVKKEMRVLTREEQSRFISYLLDDMDACKFGTFIALFTGMRIGEICALKWENISLKDGTIKVDRTMQRLKNIEDDAQTKTKIVVSSPKSDNSRRIIPMTKQAAELCRQMQPDSQASYVLTGNVHYMEPRASQYRLEKYTQECGLDGVHFHTLRHTFATRCVEVGFELKSLSEILGHSSTTLTLDRYVHASIELKRDNMSKLATIGM